MDKKNKKNLYKGYFFFLIFVGLILGGIITKRVYGHPEFMMAWHLPAAVFLVLAGKKLTYANRLRYYSRSRHKDSYTTVVSNNE